MNIKNIYLGIIYCDYDLLCVVFGSDSMIPWLTMESVWINLEMI